MNKHLMKLTLVDYAKLDNELNIQTSWMFNLLFISLISLSTLSNLSLILFIFSMIVVYCTATPCISLNNVWLFVCDWPKMDWLKLLK